MQHYFSIIIPTRKITTYLIEETLPALTRQQYSFFEVILLADEMKALRSVQKQYKWLRVIQSTKRPGIKRDQGAKQAKGTILAFIDDDAAPAKDWLEKANHIFQDKHIHALGGPGILPQNATFWEQVFNETVLTKLGGGSYTYRFRPEPKRFVDDFPSMNFFIKKNIFLKIGGFNNNYWPGEDSKLGNILAQQEKIFILYHPDVIVYHHRRNTISGHIDQYQRYGEMRGTFFMQGDINSLRLPYIIPALFVMYCVLYILAALLFITKPYDSLLFILISVPIIVYGILLLVFSIQSFIKTKSILITLGILFILPVTHIVYGFYFFRATIIETFKKPPNITLEKKK
ncbi:MAG TPA: glycosyltransferase [Candidatus Woesebacteria bacterium]|nr:glycosyltransferase [Candidatus Woesebacteria bacterium]